MHHFEHGVIRRVFAAAASIGLWLALVVPARAALIVEFQEDLGNFPDAIAVGGGVTERNGQLGVLFTLENTSYDGGNAGAGAFEADPDGDFADSDVLTPAARAAIAANQPYGIYAFGAKLPEQFAQAGLASLVEAPDLFRFQVESAGEPGFLEFTFTASLDPARGLVFDTSALGVIPNPFIDPRTGQVEFFIPALYTTDVDELIDDILAINIRPSPGIDVSTSMAWAEGDAVVTEFLAANQDFDGEELRPRGEIQGALKVVRVDLPGTAFLLAAGLLALHRRRV